MFSNVAGSWEQKVPPLLHHELGRQTQRQLGWEILGVEAEGSKALESPAEGAEIRATNHLGLPGTITVIALRVSCPEETLQPRKTGTGGHLGQASLAPAPRGTQILSREAEEILPRWSRHTKREDGSTSKIS